MKKLTGYIIEFDEKTGEEIKTIVTLDHIEIFEECRHMNNLKLADRKTGVCPKCGAKETVTVIINQ